VCSLFPGHALLEDQTRLVASLNDSPKPPAARVTLTPAALARARALLFLVAGGAKAEAVRAALLDPQATTPAARIHRAHAQSVWLLDEPAGRLLKGG
jgi:6-phosphogluconolactonase